MMKAPIHQHLPPQPGGLPRIVLSGAAVAAAAWQLVQHGPEDLAMPFAMAWALMSMLPWLAMLALVRTLPLPLSGVALAALVSLELSALCFASVGHVDYSLAHYAAKPAAQAVFLALMLAASGLLARARGAGLAGPDDEAAPNER
jgi:hypothetical protein